MAIETKTFQAFGMTYRTRKFSAVEGASMVDSDGTPPQELLKYTEALVEDEWLRLDNRDHINLCVIDMASAIPPMAVLRGLCSVVNSYNFAFIATWKGVQVPRRFTGEFKSVSTTNSKPMISQIIQMQAATLRELEEYYCLEDAFKLFDILVAKNVNEALANEAATKDK